MVEHGGQVRLWSQVDWVEISSSVTCWVALGKLLDLSEPQFPDLHNWDSNTHLARVWGD